jgi:hypothetical protein
MEKQLRGLLENRELELRRAHTGRQRLREALAEQKSVSEAEILELHQQLAVVHAEAATHDERVGVLSSTQIKRLASLEARFEASLAR